MIFSLLLLAEEFLRFLNHIYGSWLLKHNPDCEFLCTVQERSADWSIETLLLKWGLRASYEYPHDFLRGTGIRESDLTGDHTIFLLRIVRDGAEGRL